MEIIGIYDTEAYQNYLLDNSIVDNEKIIITPENNKLTLPIYKINNKNYIKYIVNCEHKQIIGYIYREFSSNGIISYFNQDITISKDKITEIENGMIIQYYEISWIYNFYLARGFMHKNITDDRYINFYKNINPNFINKEFNSLSNLEDKVNGLICRLDNIEDNIEYQENNLSDKYKLYISELENKITKLELENKITRLELENKITRLELEICCNKRLLN